MSTNYVRQSTEASGYVPDCRGSLQELFITAEEALSSKNRTRAIEAAKAACADCNVRPECLADAVNGVVSVAMVNKRERLTENDFSGVTAGFESSDIVPIAQSVLESGGSTMTPSHAAAYFD